ncbi:acyl-CoA dehydrogenase family protein [Blastococcus saxobsidens]|uniref:acyl-CoA dehydrogenase family protein n=1 Tax=Blastococcus saxobsidens TaxID=138336 RepID=UPI001EF75377|nr:acyl-CoA dehydrogenase family protein [Blastococcus saxobsidens]
MAVSFDLTEDQIELQKWVHEFAANVVRPAAAEYDEREDFPWAVLQEAAKIGLYSLDFFATQWVRRVRPRDPAHHGGALLG